MKKKGKRNEQKLREINILFDNNNIIIIIIIIYYHQIL